MSRTVYYVAASQDGFVAEAPNPGEWLREFEGARAADASFREFLAASGALAMGAETYRAFVEAPDSWPCGNTPVWVFTHHEFPGIPGADITFVRGDVAEFHPDIMHDAAEKDVLLVGGGNLAGQFVHSGLVDEMVVTVLPLSLGSGRPMLPVMDNAASADAVDGPFPGRGVEERSLGRGVVQRRYDLRR